MRQVFDGQEMQRMDRWAIEELGIPGEKLMEEAAMALCRRVLNGGFRGSRNLRNGQ